MVQALAKTELVTFSEFAEWKPENRLYELHDGVIVEMPQPRGEHHRLRLRVDPRRATLMPTRVQ